MAKAGGTAEDQDLLGVLRLFAERAGKAVIAQYFEANSILDPERRPDGSPITVADEASEEILIDALGRLTPDIPVISEERTLREGMPAQLPSRYWMVDPLDGTEQFLVQNAEFTVNLALIEEGRPTAGVVHAPALAMTWAGAGPGSAAFSQTDHPAMAIRARACPESDPVLVTHRYKGTRKSLDAGLTRLPEAKRHHAGSAMIFGLLASGKADLYARLEPSGEWTSAAGHAVLEAAGGSVETPDGKPLTYGKPGFLNQGFLAFGRR